MENETKELLRAILENVQINNAKTDGLQKQLQVLNEKVDGLGERVDGLTERMDTLTERVDALGEEMAIFRQETNINFRKLDRRIRMVEADLDLSIEKVEKKVMNG